jgi:hypothetical protein
MDSCGIWYVNAKQVIEMYVYLALLYAHSICICFNAQKSCNEWNGNAPYWINLHFCFIKTEKKVILPEFINVTWELSLLKEDRFA